MREELRNSDLTLLNVLCSLGLYIAGSDQIARAWNGSSLVFCRPLSHEKAVVKKMGGVRAEWLKLSFPADYRGSANRIQVTATASASSGFVETEEQPLKLIAQVSAVRRRIANLTAIMKESFIP